jgi:hypothetical protein
MSIIDSEHRWKWTNRIAFCVTLTLMNQDRSHVIVYNGLYMNVQFKNRVRIVVTGNTVGYYCRFTNIVFHNEHSRDKKENKERIPRIFLFGAVSRLD